MPVIKRALISTFDKTGLAPFAQALASLGVAILSTGGTARHLKEHGVSVSDVSHYTGFPEMLDGRVKTLHPRIHGGLLGMRERRSHTQEMEKYNIPPIDLVVINLYPFEDAVAKPGCSLQEAIENIDIGGPAMIRSAAKNHRSVTVITDISDYDRVLAELETHNNGVSDDLNVYLARKAFARTAAYDGAISNWLSSHDQNGTPGLFPETLTLQYHRRQSLRYGENPHQKAAFYVTDGPTNTPTVANAHQHQGKPLSFNNIHDANGAFELIREFQDPAVVIVKHANPCGAALDPDLAAAFRKARDTDPTAAFGGIIACNRPVTAAMAREITAMFVEAVVATGYEPDALKIFANKKNLRILQLPNTTTAAETSAMDMKQVAGGLLLQERDQRTITTSELKQITRRAPTKAELRDLLFAWKVVKHVKSNAIVYARDRHTVGVGAGQMSRVDASRIAVWKAREAAKTLQQTDNPIAGSALASDAFFPFRDGVDAAAEAGATAIIQPGGSIRDEEVIAAADEHGMAMLFTDCRHFRH